MKKYLFTIALIITFYAGVNYAQVTAIASGNWSDVATWAGGAVPTSADDVVVPADITVTIDNTSAVCKDLTIDGTVEFQINGDVSEITIEGNVKVNANGRFRCANRNPAGDANTFVEHLMTLKGDLTVDTTGTLDFRAGSNGGGTSNGVLLTFAGSTNSSITLQNSVYKSSTSSSSGKYGEEFNSIVIDKSDGAKVILKAGNLYMSNNSSVGGTLMTFKNGIIETEGTSIWGYLSTSGTNLTGPNGNSFVMGNMGRGLSNGGGSVRRTFHVGDNGGLRPVVLGVEAPGNSTGHLLVVKCIHGDANNNSSFDGGIDKVSEVRYYEVTYTKSGISGAASSVPLDSIGLTYGPDDGVKEGNIDLRVAYSTDNRATWIGVPQSIPYATIAPSDTSVVGGDILSPQITISEGETVYLALARVTGTTDNTLTGGTAVKKEEGMPTDYSLSQNYPNPFNPSTSISFSVPVQGNVKLTVFNALGETVETLVNEFMNAGSYNVNFDASKLTSGIYFYQINANGFTQTKKMMFIK